MPELVVQLFGGFSARTESGAPLAFSTKKARALLAYLAAQPGRSHTRSSLAALLWGDSEEEQARASLRQTLTGLRKALAPTGREHLVVRDDLVCIDPATVAVDVAMLEGLVADGGPDALDRAAELYRGALLQGFDLREEAFDAWLRAERARLETLVVDATKRLLAAHTGAGRLADAVHVAQRLLAIDPLQEDIHRALMRLYLQQGERALALKQYAVCAEVLQREIGIAPDAETERLRAEARTAGLRPEPAVNAEGPPAVRSEGAAHRIAVRPTRRGQGRGWARPTLVTAAVAAAIVVAALATWFGQGPGSNPQPGLPLPDRPSIAVLPFVNMSDDPEQSYFADGITEDLITDLSKLRGLFVIAHNSSFAYKGQTVDVRRVGRELGVRHVLEGSVRKVGDRVRINAQLVDASTGDHVWAERYDRPFADLLSVQDEIRHKIVTTLDVTLTEGEQARVWRRTTSSAAAYDLFLRARQAHLSLSKEKILQSIELLEQALELDPNFAAALVFQGWNHANLQKFMDSSEAPLAQAESYARRALAIDESLGDAYALLADLHAIRGDMEGAFAASEKAVALNPNNAKVAAIRSFDLADAGRTVEALAMINKAMRLNPHPPDWYYNALGYAYFSDKQYEKAFDAFRTCIARVPEFISCHRYLVVALMEAGRVEEARTEAKEVLKLNPKFSISAHSFWVKAAKDQTEKLRRSNLLLSAGLPQ